MKILWLCNVILPEIASTLQKKIPVTGGWISGLSNYLVKMDDAIFAFCFPINYETKIKKGNLGRHLFYGFPQNKPYLNYYDIKTESYFQTIIDDFEPDLVHIFGTEYPHSLAMTKIFNDPRRTIISIQGLVSIYALHYTANLPVNIQLRYTIRDLIKNDNILHQRKRFYQRGKYEIKAINNVNNIIGRTTWDKACISQINRNASYYLCNETLRDEFYKHKWNLDKCNKYSIFISQSYYPIKGFHFALQALRIILNEFPNVKLYTTGQNLLKLRSVDKLKISSYQLYIKELINKLHLENNICFLGELDEKQMCQRYLLSHVFVSPSSIENSSNSIGEAMLLGVPSVISDVGGVKDFFNHNIDGFLYQADAPYMLAYHVCEIFNNDQLALSISDHAHKHALQTHSKINNAERLMYIYKSILNSKNK
jgi:glycosyltransferase involved in cell wall biosynthesis